MCSRTVLFIQREVAASLRARWFLVYSGVFLVSGLLLATFGAGDVAIQGYRGFARAFAGLTHLALLFVPLMALFPATATIAEERESGALEYLLAQPVTFGEVYAGKWGGVSVAVLLALTIGFGAAAAVAVLRGVPPGLVAMLYGFVVLLALAFVALGLLLSTLTSSRARATTWGVVLWLGLVALGSLGILVAFVRWGLSEQVLVIWTFFNPVEAFRIGVVSSLDPDLSLLGPVGAKVVARFGARGTPALAGAALLVWTAVPGIVGWFAFRRAR
jgi:ABC-type transport system involved in multi-copper enzyme maturation permease subunit